MLATGTPRGVDERGWGNKVIGGASKDCLGGLVYSVVGRGTWWSVWRAQPEGVDPRVDRTHGKRSKGWSQSSHVDCELVKGLLEKRGMWQNRSCRRRLRLWNQIGCLIGEAGGIIGEDGVKKI